MDHSQDRSQLGLFVCKILYVSRDTCVHLFEAQCQDNDPRTTRQGAKGDDMQMKSTHINSGFQQDKETDHSHAAAHCQHTSTQHPFPLRKNQTDVTPWVRAPVRRLVNCAVLKPCNLKIQVVLITSIRSISCWIALYLHFPLLCRVVRVRGIDTCNMFY